MAVKFGFFCGDNDNGKGSALCAKRKFLDDDDDDAALAPCHNNNIHLENADDDTANKNVIIVKSDQVQNNPLSQCIDYICLISYAILEFVFSRIIFVRKRFGLFAVIIILLLQLNGLIAESVAGTETPILSGIIPNQYGDVASAKEFSRHLIIEPSIQHSRHKRHIDSTKMNDGLHAKTITLKYKLNGNNVIIDLNLNENLTPDGHFLRYQSPTGDKIVQNFTKTDIDLCHYKGTIRDNEKSSVAISTCSGIKGIIYDGVETFYIDPMKLNSTLTDDHFLYRHSDMTHSTKKCGYDGGINKTHDIDLYEASEFQRVHRFKRSSSKILPSSDDTIIRGPYNANKHSSFVELVLVVDNKLYKSMGENMKRVQEHCIDIANIINALYVPLNIFIALVGVVVWNESNEAILSSDGDATLKNFLKYRREKLVKDHPNDNAQLLTKEQFEGGVVGKALKGPICTYEFSGGVSMDHSNVVSVVATTVAHEMGHNFGMEHDTPDCKCVDERCIMSASSSSVPPLHWSSCSIDQLNLAFHQGMNYCLRNKPTKLFDSPRCGNGFVEPGEQCDCGLPNYCENSCCNPETCMLRTNASCATGECCDLTTCHPRTAGTVCREVAGECDLPEYCTGESEYCPSDYFKRDTEECGNGKAYCYQGSCRSRDDQCQVLWGSSGKSSDPCYNKNTNGSRHGNCGYDRLVNKYKNCSLEDKYCGMVQCRHLNEKLEFGMESVAVLSHSFISFEGNIIPCRTVIVDLGLQSVDPGLVPDGAKCAAGKMCVQQKCVSIESLRANGKAPECPANCSNHGVCNDKGLCHCDVGFAPPLCNSPGPGGSEVGGPATNPNDGAGVVRIMYIFFLGVVPFISLVLFFVYYWRQNKPTFLRKAPNVDNRRATNFDPRLPEAFRTSLKATAIKKSPQRGGGNSGSGGGGGGSASSPGRTMSTPSSTDDMNSSLLKPSTSGDPNDSTQLNNNMFGHFKGFTLKPLPPITHNKTPPIAFVHPVSKQIDVVPNRAAPPIPKASTLMRKQSQITPVDTMVQQIISTAADNVPNEMAPPLPPFNPGSTPRPIISSPILEASTCSAKELISPLRHTAEKFPDQKIPLRPAPVAPSPSPTQTNSNSGYEQPIRTADYIIPVHQKTSVVKESAIKRIASFLKKDDKAIDSQNHQNSNLHSQQNTLTKKLKPSIDKEKLRSIEISSPIPVDANIESSSNDSSSIRSSMITRTQSMRDPSQTTIDGSTVAKRSANIHTFGSMRNGSKPARPGSMIGTRPKSPPPPRPPAPPAITSLKICGVPGYQNPPSPSKRVNTQNPIENEYDDCEAIEGDAPLAKITEDISPTNSDNIYSVIDEYERPPIPPPSDHLLSPKSQLPAENSGSMGLLGEICNEIENLNLNSIYSVSTLARKKKDHPAQSSIDSNDYGSGDSDYMNMKSNSSTTSSGYLRPSAINAPIARVAPVKSVEPPVKPITNNLSSFKRKEVDDTTKPTLNSFRRQTSTQNTTTIPSPMVNGVTTTESSGNNKYFNNRPTPITTKPTTANLNNKPSSPVAAKKMPFNRTKTPPSLQSSTRLRTRSPSPASQSNTKTNATTKSTGPDIVNSISSTNNKVKQQPDVLNNTQTQSLTTKPKPLTTKPTLGVSLSSDIKSSPVVGTIDQQQQKPKWQSTGRVGVSTVDSKPPFSNSGSGSIGGVNKFNRPFGNSTASATATTGKGSSIASLQKKFETTGNVSAIKEKVNATTAFKK